MLLSALGFLSLSGWDAAVSEPRLSLDLATTGLGFGLVLAPLAGSAFGVARGGNKTVGTASLTIARMIGMMIGLSSLTIWGLVGFEDRVAHHPLPLPTPGQSPRRTTRSWNAMTPPSRQPPFRVRPAVPDRRGPVRDRPRTRVTRATDRGSLHRTRLRELLEPDGIHANRALANDAAPSGDRPFARLGNRRAGQRCCTAVACASASSR
jgi:hypothetical protein